ncbi:glutamate ABC transporter substrate-binding protein [Streptomyces sp. NBC_01803]|uniref:glutamate ABC transporter substrate-binding protein n=1 Tax=Streptomyces sp. NBC_01803 TaxID=2975946 RepID=UPI002DD948E2|nr:glutamate ABC transporter substrate-binding protein [Streptomyces sp. NBC_01803]WSA46182.1 glutamate ABC transporter substrate-binding protein [Streptomyces sp. NBC_01803]
MPENGPRASADRRAAHGGGRAGRRDVRALLLAAAGLALAGSVLAGSLPPDLLAGPPAAPHGRSAEAEYADDRAPSAARERCADGRDPAESFPPGRVRGAAVEEIQERGQLVVGIDQNSYLWGYRSPQTGDIVGFDIDLVMAIAEDLLGPDPDVRFLAIPTDQRIPAVQDGTVDMVVRTMSITCERWQDVAFSTAYFETGQQLLVPANSSIQGFDESLDGMRVCSANGSTASKRLESESHGADLVGADNHLDCLVRVQLGLADALMTDSALAAGHVAQDPSMRLADDPLTQESYGVAMNLANTDLVSWVNAVLEDYREPGPDGTRSEWRQSYDRWLARYLYDEETDPPPAPPRPQYRD